MVCGTLGDGPLQGGFAMQNMQEIIETVAARYERGDYSHVMEICEGVLRSGRDDWQLLHFLAKAAYQLGNFPQAQGYARRAVTQAPREAAVYNTWGVILEAQGRFDEAERAYSQAVELNCNFAEAWLNMAIVHTSGRRWSAAQAACGKAIALRPDWARAHDVMGFIKENTGAQHEAEESVRRALQLDETCADARNHLGALLNQKGDFAAAAVQLRKAVEQAPDHAEAWNNLGISENGLERFEEAARCFQRAIQLEDGFAHAHYNLGKALREMADLEGAITAYEQAIEHMPDFLWAKWNLSHALLASGRFDEGWSRYAVRHDRPLGIVTYPHDLDLPRWDGQRFDGRRLLVHYEQGLGDNIQFVRYLPMVKELGGTVVLEAPWPLYGLFKDCEGCDELILAGEQPPAGHFDLTASPLDFPGIFQTRPETVPARVPYLFADVDKARAWWTRLRGNALKVGIVWAGSPAHGRDRQRSEWFMPLSQIEGVRVYSLQKGPAAEQLSRFDTAGRITDLADDLKDFSDLAAAMINLDLIITVDTAAAHLAGAMAKPVWTLLPCRADWRWMLDRDDSPWYPSMKLFRQKRRGDWADVFRRVTKELQKTVATVGAEN